MGKSLTKVLFSLAILLMIGAGLSGETTAQIRQTTRGNDVRVRNLTQRIRVQSNNFRTSFDAAIQNVRLRGTAANNINRSLEDFETAFSSYDEHLGTRQATVADVEQILDAASNIDSWMRNNRLNARVERDWANLKLSLTQLAREYNLNWNGDSYAAPNSNNYPANPNRYPANSGVYNSRLTGTFRLDTTRSDNPREVADRALYQLSSSERERERVALEQRLETPEMLAIDQRGQEVTIASTRAQRYTFTADGRDKFEAGSNGTQLRVRASLVADRLEVITLGDRDNDYSVIFEPLDNGRSLRVTRRLSTDFLRQPVVVTSIYEKTSQVAQLDIYERPVQSPNNSSRDNRFPRGNRRTDDFIIRDGTTLRATLNEALSTKTANENDRFSMTVQTPDEYQGAVIEGYLTGINRSGRVSGRANLTFNFEQIRLRDGRTYSFAGFVESVRNNNGDEIKIDNEGKAQGENQTTQTATRGALGAGVGAIIGAIAGGGKGAAIGAIIGAGAGAGSVYIEGREDLEINSGSDVYIRASAPARTNERY